MNRTLIRGVTSAVLGTALCTTALVAGPQTARGEERSASWAKPLPAADQAAAMHWRLPNVRYLRHVHPVRHRHVVARASRTTTRAPLTGSPQTVAHALVLRRGWDETQWNCLDSLWMRESGWNTYATNPSSGAYGIPQALPASKMATFGSDYRTNPITQIEWGLSYIATSYGTPCAALSHSSSSGYY